MTTFGYLHDYSTGESLRPASAYELAESLNAGPEGVIQVGGRACYVVGQDDDTDGLHRVWLVDATVGADVVRAAIADCEALEEQPYNIGEGPMGRRVDTLPLWMALAVRDAINAHVGYRDAVIATTEYSGMGTRYSGTGD